MKNSLKPIIAILVILLIWYFLIFKKQSKNKNLTEWDIENIRNINSNDNALAESKISTQKALSNFITEFENNDRNKEFYAKIKLTENDLIEHMWLIVLTLNGENSKGIVDNEPLKFKNIKYLDTLKFNIKEAEDLMIYENDSLIMGGFLMSILNNK